MALDVPRFRRSNGQGSSTEDPPAQTTQDPSFALPEAGGIAARPEPLVGPPRAPEPEEPSTVGVGPYRLALRRLRRNKTALFFAAVFVLIVVVCLLAPVYSNDIAKIGPNVTNVTGTVNGHNIVSVTGVPIGPQFGAHYFFGADNEGRDLAVRLLYGGRTSLLIGGVATLLILVFGTLVGLFSGYFRGVVDAILRPIMELIWSFPPVILGVAVGTALALGGIGPIKGNSVFIPALIIGVIYIPYLGKPIRGEALRLREMDFVDAARVQGISPWRVMFSEILPNTMSTIIVFVPIMLANAILLEAYLSFLGAGVQPPNASWGTLISDGIQYLDTTPSFALIPGAMLVLTVLSINVFGDGVRDALDPRAQVKIKT
ncbi:MAG: ABC transporter permease [Solirubrobacteraceae bacterium]